MLPPTREPITLRVEAALVWTTVEKSKEKRKKQKKRAQRVFFVYPPRRTQKMIFYIRTVKRNRNEIETQKKSDFEHPTKEKKNKEKIQIK